MATGNGRRRVVVTGLGAITPLGNSVDEMWANAIAGKSGSRSVHARGPHRLRLPGRLARSAASTRTSYMDRKDARRMARFSQFAVAAARQAVDQAGLDLAHADTRAHRHARRQRRRCAAETEKAMRTIIARGGIEGRPALHREDAAEHGRRQHLDPARSAGLHEHRPTACAAGTQAIGDAAEVIRRGAADVMLAGGAEAGISELGLAGFCAMRALATTYDDEPEKATRPFDRDRDGFVAAEGAGILVLEGLDHAQARGAEVLAEVVGYGVSADAAYLVAPPENGEGAARAMRLALADAGIDPDEIDYLSAHATSTEVGDIAETRAIKTVFGERAYRLPVTAMKSQIGHLLGGAGGVETVAVVRTIQTGVVAPTINLDTPDPECDLDYVPNEARHVDVRTVMKNSFGFGGQNAVLIIRRFED